MIFLAPLIIFKGHGEVRDAIALLKRDALRCTDKCSHKVRIFYCRSPIETCQLTVAELCPL
jgi:hypothetical protein